MNAPTELVRQHLIDPSRSDKGAEVGREGSQPFPAPCRSPESVDRAGVHGSSHRERK